MKRKNNYGPIIFPLLPACIGTAMGLERINVLISILVRSGTETYWRIVAYSILGTIMTKVVNEVLFKRMI